MTKMAKLDYYDCTVNEGCISIEVDGLVDPDLVDIMSDVERANGLIYLDGQRYIYKNNYRLFGVDGRTFIELDVAQA